MILRDFKELILSKSTNRQTIPASVDLPHRVHTALKQIALKTIPLRLIVNEPNGSSILRKIDEVTYIRIPRIPNTEEDSIDIDDVLLDACALYVIAGIEKEKAGTYMGMFFGEIDANNNRLIETALSEATNESAFNNSSFRFA